MKIERTFSSGDSAAKKVGYGAFRRGPHHLAIVTVDDGTTVHIAGAMGSHEARDGFERYLGKLVKAEPKTREELLAFERDTIPLLHEVPKGPPDPVTKVQKTKKLIAFWFYPDAPVTSPAGSSAEAPE